MTRNFLKMHGLGNDFAVFDARGQALEVPAEKIRALADRRTGIGFDQMIVIDAARSPETDLFMRIYNADGTEVGACGNATRCVAMEMAQVLNKDAVVIETKAGKLIGRVVDGGVCVDMGIPQLEWQKIPLSTENKTENIKINVSGLSAAVAVNVGNPHAVFFVPDAEAVDVAALGPQVENHPLFPEKTNVEFVHVSGPDRLRMRVWERGAGITQACGTGACAVAVAAVRRGLTGRKVAVVLDGGILEIEWRESDGHVLMTGPATKSYKGEINL